MSTVYKRLEDNKTSCKSKYTDPVTCSNMRCEIKKLDWSSCATGVLGSVTADWAAFCQAAANTCFMTATVNLFNKWKESNLYRPIINVVGRSLQTKPVNINENWIRRTNKLLEQWIETLRSSNDKRTWVSVTNVGSFSDIKRIVKLCRCSFPRASQTFAAQILLNKTVTSRTKGIHKIIINPPPPTKHILQSELYNCRNSHPYGRVVQPPRAAVSKGWQN